MLYIDKLFINKVSFNLDRFKWMNNTVATFRCPLCGDSKRNKRKTRGYFYISKDSDQYRFCCKNCSKDYAFWWYLKMHHPTLYQDYKLEKLRGRGVTLVDEKKPVGPISTLSKLNLKNISELGGGHKARLYVWSRQIPEKHHKSIFYTENVYNFVLSLVKDPKLCERYLPKDALVLPMLDENKYIRGLNFRYFDNEFRYQILFLDKDFYKVYGLERFNRNKPTFVVEGPIDSLFLPNCLAACGADLRSLERYIDKEKTILVFDNEPRNEQIVVGIEKAIKENYNVYIPPSGLDGLKDINDMIQAGYSSRRIIELIVSSSPRGLLAKLALQSWRKC